MVSTTQAERASARALLRAAGIIGSELETGLNHALALASAAHYAACHEDLATLTRTQIIETYGHDSSRHVSVLARDGY
jgi:hypothetical protein